MSSGPGKEESAWEWSGVEWVVRLSPRLGTAGHCRGNIQTKPSCHNQLSRHTPGHSHSVLQCRHQHSNFPTKYSLFLLLITSTKSRGRIVREKTRPRAPVKIRGIEGRVDSFSQMKRKNILRLMLTKSISFVCIEVSQEQSGQ